MNVLYKDYVRAIFKSFQRFLSVFMIIAVGAGLFTGLKSVGPAMRATADKYYAESKFMDFKMMGNYGLDDGDVKVLKNLENVDNATGSYSVDAFDRATGDNLRFMSVPAPGDVNSINLIDGRLPEKAGECLADAKLLREGKYKIGDAIEPYYSAREGGGAVYEDNSLSKQIINPEKAFKLEKFTIVGSASSPMYQSNDRGVSKLGDGTSKGFILIRPEDFAYPYFTEVYVRFKSSSEISSFDKDFDQAMYQEYALAIEAITSAMPERFVRLSAEPRKKISDAEAMVKKAKEDIELNATLLSDAKGQLALAQGMKDVDMAPLEAQLAGISERQDFIADAQATLAHGEARIAENQAFIPKAEKELEDEKRRIVTRYAAYMSNYNLYNFLPDGPAKDKMFEVIKENKAWLDAAQQAFDAKTADVANRKAETETLSAQIAPLKSQIAAAQTWIEQTQAAYDTAYAEAMRIIDFKKNTVKKSQAQVDKSQKILDDSKIILEEKMQEVEDATQALNRMEKITYYADNRSVVAGYTDYGANAGRLDAVATVFPIFFIVVAALVCWTSMTRMVEEDNVLIGTYKATGLSDLAISGKYLNYAVSAAVLGSAVGLALGFRYMPSMIMRAYGSLYSIPIISTPFHWDYAAYVLLGALFCTLTPTLTVCADHLRQCPAQLMRPKAPKSGKTILLEKIKPIWIFLSFNMRMTMRNLFRYKKRMFMTIAGIAGGTAMMLTGFGLKNALSGVVNLQYGQILHYDIKISLEDKADKAQRSELDKLLKKYSAKSLNCYEESIQIEANGKSENVSMIVGEKNKPINDFITLRSRESKEEIAFTSTSVIISEKLALLLGVDVDDQISFKDGEGFQYMATITDVTENYTGHYIYMGEKIYSDYFSIVPEYTTVLIKADKFEEGSASLIAEQANKMDFVRSATMTDVLKLQYGDVVSSMDIIVYFLIFAAAVLAFVVLYNLSAINIAERMRELCTFKVLGFNNWELTGYIGRENVILTVAGILIGLGGGIFLCRYVVDSVEVNALMFGRDISQGSFIFAAALTLAFTLLANFVMMFSMKKINMVEALKANDN
ncbi:MAG: FtsX-like permease family protein [Oscillospiraceae bacterium]|jgi:putative ABC transport system permease protein|nr:FtsX-like permease family protein [Oscillospiraceae bacterium]